MYMKGDNGYFRNAPDYDVAQSEGEEVKYDFNSILTDDPVETASASEKRKVEEFIGDYTKIQEETLAKAEPVSEEAISVKRENYVLSSTGKVLIAVYTFLIVAIFAFIIFNANYLRGLDRKIETAQTEVEQIKQVVKDKQLELDYVSDPETIIEKAVEELGMVPRY